MTDDLSPTMRDYLAEIYRLSDRSPTSDNRFISTSALADVLDVSAPAVNRMVTRLKDMDLLDHEPYHGIRLTEAGERESLKELRRHRIAESFLVEVMGFGWHEVHDEANSMSSGLSDALAERMAVMAGNPIHCPHGEPIPSVDGVIERPDDIFLSDAPTGDDPLVITRVLTRESDRLDYLAALGLVPGAQVHVIHIAPFNGPMQLKMGEAYRIIGHNLAEFIRVKSDSLA